MSCQSDVKFSAGEGGQLRVRAKKKARMMILVIAGLNTETYLLN